MPHSNNPDDRQTSEDEGGWPHITGYDVKQERYIRIPNRIQAAIQTETINGPSVFWNFDKNSSWIVLSSNPIADDAYVSGDYTKIQDPDEDYSRIRPPKALGDSIISKFEPDNHLIYLSRQEMICDDNPSTFLLTQREIDLLLPTQDDTPYGDVRDQLLDNPGFLPSI